MSVTSDQKLNSSGSYTALPSFLHKDGSSGPLGEYNNKKHNLSDLHPPIHSNHHHHYSRRRHHVRDTISAVQTQLPVLLKDRRLHASPGNINADGGNRSADIAITTNGVKDLDRKASDAQPNKILNSTGIEGAHPAGRSNVSESRLRTTLDAITDHAVTSTSQLDDSYYSLLEHVGYLRSGVEQLIALSKSVRRASSEFDLQVGQLNTDLQGQLDALGNFDLQGQRVHELENKLNRERENTEDLKNRLDLVRERLRTREREDAESWKQTRLRLRILWGAIVTAILLFCTIAIFQNFWASSSTRLSRTQKKTQMENSGAIHDESEWILSTIATASNMADKEYESTRSDRWQYILDEL